MNDIAAEAWRSVAQGDRLNERQLARITAICCVSQEQLRAAIGALASVAGMLAIERRSGFARAWRDLQTPRGGTAVSRPSAWSVPAANCWLRRRAVTG